MNREFVKEKPVAAGENLRAVLCVRAGVEMFRTVAVGGLSRQREASRECCERHGFEVFRAGGFR